jgi:hypothetical protein
VTTDIAAPTAGPIPIALTKASLAAENRFAPTSGGA